ncbi:4-hydroxybenzoate 3-monooxygenase [Streptomyces polygonati]|uniref:4-hydroxybenzoate 3-monooxygenase n=1 Tax=Streptomyces polygonati TaxID=1617087 RepID=A0ABV8HWZ1_9ACTN
MTAATPRTTVGIIGAGPAGLLLARLLHRAGVDCVVLEHRDRDYVERRQRAGTLEQTTVDALRDCGAGERLDREGLFLDGIELRFGGRAHSIDFASLAGGRGVAVYPQTKVVQDLVGLQLADGPPLLFEARVHRVTGTDADRPVIHYTYQGEERTVRCDYVAACDGSMGVGRQTVLDHGGRLFGRGYPYSWFGVLADVAPSCDTLLYAHSPSGFALHSMRSPTVSRLYLQVPNGTRAEDLADEQIWDALYARFEVDGDWKLRRGPITAKSVIPMRSEVVEPMRSGRLFLAGDAAHVMPPTGAKGLNLAVADVLVLSRALIDLLRHGRPALLDAYSDSSLRRAWQAEHFSWFMTRTMHLAPDQSPFDTRLQLAALDQLVSSPLATAEFAHSYVGQRLEGDHV